ncbi:MAG TPA: hypothetical protein VF231_05935 [Candidatus Limnocylindrales bacterium]|jgi:hypothetical protein
MTSRLRSRRHGAFGAFALVLAVAGGCGDAATGPPGSIVVRVEWIEPGPGAEPILGGYAFFARATGPAGPGPEAEIRDGLVVEAPAAGSYLVEAWSRHESDAVAMEDVPGGTPRTIRTFGRVDATCSAEVSVGAGETVGLVMRATPGHCELVREDDSGR